MHTDFIQALLVLSIFEGRQNLSCHQHKWTYMGNIWEHKVASENGREWKSYSSIHTASAVSQGEVLPLWVVRSIPLKPLEALVKTLSVFPLVLSVDSALASNKPGTATHRNEMWTPEQVCTVLHGYFTGCCQRHRDRHTAAQAKHEKASTGKSYQALYRIKAIFHVFQHKTTECSHFVSVVIVNNQYCLCVVQICFITPLLWICICMHAQVGYKVFC